MNTYHDIRSVRSWLNEMYPDVPILVQRNVQKQKKSYFFIQDSREKFEDSGRGYYNTVRTVNIHLVTEGPTIRNPGSQDAYWKTMQVINFLKDRLLRERVIPAFVWNHQWWPPTTWTKGGGGTLPAGTYELACSSVDAYDKESLLSEPVSVTVSAGEHLHLNLMNWPLGHPLNKELVLYTRATPTANWEAVQVVPTTVNNMGSTQVEVTGLTPLSPTRHPVTTSKQWMGYLKVDTVTTNMVESGLVDDAFHGFVNVTFRSRAPQQFRTFPPIQTVGTSI